MFSLRLGSLVLAAAWMLQGQQPGPAVGPTADQEHQAMLDEMHLPALRPGVSANPKAANPVNYDEALAGPATPLPDPLRLANGQPVTNAKEWWTKRRPELLEMLTREEYGRPPDRLPRVTWKLTSKTQETVSFDDAAGAHHSIPTETNNLTGHVDNSTYPAVSVDIDLHVTVPVQAGVRVPLMLYLAFDPPAPKPGQAVGSPPAGPSWEDQVLARGWGYAVLFPTSVQPDNPPGLRHGIIGLMNHGALRKPDEWGALRAWAWGASRVMDYLETDPAVNPKAVAVMGHSRFGKAALATMIYDQRFAAAYISSSGAGGTALWRHNVGEQLENIVARGEFHWMDGNLMRYAADPETRKDLPFDQHEAIALCAPRPVFIGAGTVKQDGWADPQGMFLAAVAASPVYRLLGRRGLSDTQGPVTAFPPTGTSLAAGDLAYRQHSEGHTPLPNVPFFLDFAGRYLKETK